MSCFITLCHTLTAFNCLRMNIQYIVGEELWPAVIIVAVNLIPLIALRSVRNMLAVPFVILHDFKECAFVFPTRFRTLVSFNWKFIFCI